MHCQLCFIISGATSAAVPEPAGCSTKAAAATTASITTAAAATTTVVSATGIVYFIPHTDNCG